MKRTMIIAVAGITALMLAGCSSTESEYEPTNNSAPTSNSSPSTEEPSPKEEPSEGDGEKVPEETGKETTVELDEFADEMFIAVTDNLDSSANLPEADRLAMGKEVCVKIEAEDADFETLVSWAEKEAELSEGAGEVFASSAISAFCLENIDLVNDYKGTNMEDM